MSRARAAAGWSEKMWVGEFDRYSPGGKDAPGAAVFDAERDAYCRTTRPSDEKERDDSCRARSLHGPR